MALNFGDLALLTAGDVAKMDTEARQKKIDDRLDELESKEQWRDIVALVQEYKEWSDDDDLEFEMIWMDRIKTITSD